MTCTLLIEAHHDEPISIVPGERAPGRRWGMSPNTEGGEAPTGAGAERRTRWPPCGWACPISGRERPAHDADRRAFRRFAAALSLDLETAFWKRTGAAIRNALDPAGFSPCVHPPHQPVAGRTHVVGPGSVSRDPRRSGCVDRTRRRRPRSVNKRHRLTPSVEQGWIEYRRGG